MLVVDVSNVLQATGVLPAHLAGPDLPDLARLIAISRYRTRRAVLVCDGRAPGSAGLPYTDDPPGHDWPSSDAAPLPAPTNLAPDGREIAGMDVLYAGAGREADDVIELLIARDSAPRRLLVVSTDRRLVRAARRRRAQSLTSQQFLAQLAHDAEKPSARALPGFATQVPLNPYDVAYWLAAFGYDPIPAGPPRQAPTDAPPRPGSHTPASARPPAVCDAARATDQPSPGTRPRSAGWHTHERLKVPADVLRRTGMAQGHDHPHASAPPAPLGPPSGPTPDPTQAPPADPGRPDPSRTHDELHDLLKDSGLEIDPADLDMRRWLPPPT